MSRYLVLTFLILSIVGCGSGTASSNAETPTGQAGNAETGGAVSMAAPGKTKIGETTLKEACEHAGMKPYPGAEDAKGEIVDRGNGEVMDKIDFSTTDSIDKVGTFYRQEGLDTKVSGTEGSAMGPTKTNASVIIGLSSSGGKTTVLFKSVRSAEKKP